MNMIRILFFLTALICFSSSKAQDVLYKQNGNKVNVIILNGGLDFLSYRLYNSVDTTVYTISKKELKKITYANGNSETYAKVKKANADGSNYNFRINPLSPLFGYMQVGVEQRLNSTSSLEINLSFIGLGINSQGPASLRQTINFNNPSIWDKKNQSGASIAFGYKVFMSDQSARFSQSNLTHTGLYIKPTIYAGGFGYNSYNAINNPSGFSRDLNKVFFAALIIEPGLQLAITRHLTFETYLGIGFVFDNIDRYKSSFADDAFGYDSNLLNGGAYLYNIYRISENSPGLAMTGGVKLGWTLNSKSTSKKK
jgi:hypothetical protein